MNEDNLIGAEAAALAEDNADAAAEAAVLSRIAGDTETDDDAEDDGVVAAAAADTDTDEAAEEVAQAAAQAPTSFGPLAPMPVPDTSGLADEKTTLLADRAKARADYSEGELSRDDLDTKLDLISDRLSEINSTISDAASAARFNHSVAVANYTALIGTVKAEALAEGIDYNANKTLLQIWDGKVRAMGADPEMAAKGDPWILREAHKQTVADFQATAKAMGLTLPTPTGKATELGAEAAMRQAVKTAIAGRAKDAGGVKSLASLPEAAATVVAGDTEFSRLDKLDGMALERELAKLSPEAQVRYLDRV